MTKKPSYEELEKQFVEQKDAIEKISKLNEIFSLLGKHPRTNIEVIVQHTAKLLQGTCCLYNRLDNKKQSLIAWAYHNLPSDFICKDTPDGHICYEVTMNEKDKPVVIGDIGSTVYHDTDSNVKKYGLKSYLGFPVLLGGNTIGALCIVDIKKREFSETEIHIISTLAKAVSLEEERNQAERALFESEEWHRNFLENLSDGVFEADDSGNITYANKISESVTGLPLKDIIGKPFLPFFDKKSQEIAVDVYLRTLNGESPEYELTFNNGKIGHFKNKPRRNKDGKIIGVFGVARDLTELKIAEEALRAANERLEKQVKERTAELKEKNTALKVLLDQLKKSEKRYRLLAENVTDIIWTMDMNMNFTYYSPSITRLQGFTVEEALARSVKESMTPASFDTVIKAITEELEIHNKGQKSPDRSRKVEVELFCKDGSTIWAEVEANFIYDAYGQPQSIIGVTRDITDRKRAEEALKKSEKKYRLLTENANDVIWTADLTLKATYMSPSIERIRGYTPEEALNQTIEEVLTPDSLEYAKKTFDKELEQLQKGIKVDDLYTVEVECYHKDGSTIWMENKISPLKDLKGETIGIFGISRDITKRRQTEQQLLRSEKLASLGNMVAGVAHEISTPLGVGLMSASYLNDKTHEFSELFNSGGVEHSKVKKYADKATEASSMVLSNLRRAVDILDSFKQVAVDQIVEERRTFDLKTNIEDTLKSLRPKYKRTAHTITVECPDNLKICSYPGAYSQIITNLVMNSLNHGFDGIEKGEIVLTADKKKNMLLLKYRDTGKGMDKATLKKLFDPFFTTSRSKGGTGLGMHIVHNLVYQILRGQIECKSSVGKGTEFVIEIPLSDTVEC